MYNVSHLTRFGVTSRSKFTGRDQCLVFMAHLKYGFTFGPLSVCDQTCVDDVPWGADGQHKVKGYRHGSTNFKCPMLNFMACKFL